MSHCVDVPHQYVQNMFRRYKSNFALHVPVYFIILAFNCRARCSVRTINYSRAAGVGAPQAVDEFEGTLN